MSSLELEIFEEGESFCVFITTKAMDEFEKLEDRQQNRLTSQIQLFARHGKPPLKDEGRHKCNDGKGSEIQLFAFGDASSQIRIYGGYTHAFQERSFTCVKCVEKKRNKAKPSDLQYAADMIGRILKNDKN
jgi:hypothetical protein